MNPAANHTQNHVKDLRVQIDAVIKRIESEFAPSRELALVKTKLQEAKMWAGQELGRMGSSLPAEFRDEATVSQPDAAPAAPAAPEHITPNPAEAPQPAVSPEVVAPTAPVPATPAGDPINIPVQDAEVVVEPAEQQPQPGVNQPTA